VRCAGVFLAAPIAEAANRSYGIGGLMRGIFVPNSSYTWNLDLRRSGILLYPSKMLYPGVLPLLSMFDAVYRDGIEARRRLKVFYFVFTACV
jgi:hypothetical protein